MDGELITMNTPETIETEQIEASASLPQWTRGIAAGSFLVGGLLLLTGRRKSALAVAAAGAAVALLENPEAVREFWNSIPRYLRSGQDLLVRMEDFVGELEKQGIHLRGIVSQHAPE